MEMFISFFTGKVMLFYGISLIMKEKSNASALIWEQRRSSLGPDAVVAGSRDGRGTFQIRQKAWGLDWGGDGETGERCGPER